MSDVIQFPGNPPPGKEDPGKHDQGNFFVELTELCGKFQVEMVRGGIVQFHGNSSHRFSGRFFIHTVDGHEAAVERLNVNLRMGYDVTIYRPDEKAEDEDE